ncbi:sterile alpha motif domain-containing protein 1-like [Neofelis nebulosa]|uniref:sterile alpha motif domain-containing protein 1-like n=1 Tax=Neofelis nebulosa TaxID=61452 RepID=UPI00272B90DE|nr:sterile alpha motif domain-containing protein 1-like [Neofelis nebulosa]XP_058590897.1 sterile alpha motif domain-containing protein 1-like [Neofelis nebulosa]
MSARGPAADAQEKPGGAEKASADRTAGLRAAAPQAARTSAAARREQTSRAAPPPPSLRRPSGPPRQCRPAAPRSPAPLTRRGGRWGAVRRGRGKNNLERRSSPPGADARVQNWLGGLALRLGWGASTQASGKGERAPAPSFSSGETDLLPTHSDSFTLSRRAAHL